VTRRFILRAGLGVIALFFVAYAALYFLQDRIIFQRVKLEPLYGGYKFDYGYEEYFIKTGPNMLDSINVLVFNAGDSVKSDSMNSKGLILYFHGNRGNLQRWGRYAPDFTQYGYDVMMIDYRGYGKSSGTPSEENLYFDGAALYQFAKRRNAERLIIYGRSLGSAVASRLAADQSCDLLVLETPFDNLRGVIPSPWNFLAPILPLRHRMSNVDHLKLVDERVVIFHGTEDPIVPLNSALRLRPLLKRPDDFIIIPGGRHRNLGRTEPYQKKIRELLETP